MLLWICEWIDKCILDVYFIFVQLSPPQKLLEIFGVLGKYQKLDIIDISNNKLLFDLFGFLEKYLQQNRL
jgi:hypothetical protein